MQKASATMVLTVGYRGAGFSGFAAQADAGVRTVAGELDRALSTFLRRPVELTCAGRTDAGVHALGQVVSVPVTAEERALPADRIVNALSALTPDDIAIREVRAAAPGFSARFDALARNYRYRIAVGRPRPTFSYDFAWHLRAPLDLAAMREAAVSLLGEHDFKSFCKTASAEGKSTVRDLQLLAFHETVEFGEPLVAVDVRASSFLHNMVRALVGTLVEVGQGRRPVAWPAEVLAACDRAAAGPTAPAKGLTFQKVSYPAGSLLPW